MIFWSSLSCLLQYFIDQASQDKRRSPISEQVIDSSPSVDTMSSTTKNGGGIDQEKAKAILEKYEEERLKRTQAGGLKQFITTSDSTRYHHFGRDIWVDDSIPGPGANSIKDGSSYEILILGAGYGGLLAAVRLIESGMDVNGIRIVDTAGGFGGTWWFNRWAGVSSTLLSSSNPI